MNDQELVFLSAKDLSNKIKSREISPVEAVNAYLERINTLDGKLNAYITVMTDEALSQALIAEREIASGTYRGPLHGVPVGIKDQIYTKGIRTSSASKIRSDFVPDYDATVVAGLKRSGAIILGKLNMTEFAMGDPITSAFGITHNPWDVTRNPGVQIPHCKAACSKNFFCKGWSVSPSARPSTVATSLPSASTPRTKQESMDLPSIITLQAPQSPVRHPSFVPVRPTSSRNTSSKLWRGSQRNSVSSPFIVVCTCTFFMNTLPSKKIS